MEEQNLTNRQIELGAGLTKESFSKYLQGTLKISAENCRKLAKFLKVKDWRSLTLEDYQVPKEKLARYNHRAFQQNRAHKIQKLVKELNSTNDTVTNLFAGYKESER